MTEPTLFLKPGREKSILRRHPWIFSGAVDRASGASGGGETVRVCTRSGEFLARAAYNPRSQIAARVWSWAEDEPIDPDFFATRLSRAMARRDSLKSATNAVRLVNAESDGVPGLIVDRYADHLVCQFLTAGAERWKDAVVRALAAAPGVRGVYERSDVDVRAKEGLPPARGVVHGGAPPAAIEIWESAPPGEGAADRWRYPVDVAHGHKTGFYLDQRENRKTVAGLACGQRTLNVFCYSGAFSVSAWWGRAQEVISLDSSAPALALAERTLALNGFPTTGLVEADAFKALREFRDRGDSFDLIVLDPPKLARSEAQIERAARGYKDLNWLAFRLLRPGGHLVSFSCSGVISEDLFQKILFGAALDAKRDAQIVGRLSQASDHPVLLSFPESAYLKGFVCRVE